jgi:opacity protein-like surface antigen
MRKIALLSLLMLLLAVPAFAAAPNYFVLKGGIYSPGHADLTDDPPDFGIGFNGEVAFGHYFTPNVALELGAGYLSTKKTISGVEVTVSSIPILLSVKGVAPFPQGELYALVGGGAYISEIEGTTSGFGVNVNKTAFGFQAGIGGSYNITPEVFLGLEGKYFWAAPEFSAGGITDKVNIDGFQATANVGFRF